MESLPPDILSPNHIRHGIKFLVGGGYLVYLSLGALKLYRFTKTLPVSKIRSLAVGPVHVVGNLVSTNQYIGHISERQGSLVVTEVDVWRLGRWWTVVLYEGAWKDLHIKDETGMVEIDPKQFQSRLKPAFKYRSWSGDTKPANLESFMQRIRFKDHINLLGIKIPKPYRIREYVVNEEPVEVFGYATSDPIKKRLVITEAKDTTFLIQEKDHKNVPYRSLVLLSLGSILIALGIVVSLFSTAGVGNLWGQMLLIIVFIGLMLGSAKLYKLI